MNDFINCFHISSSTGRKFCETQKNVYSALKYTSEKRPLIKTNPVEGMEPWTADPSASADLNTL